MLALLAEIGRVALFLKDGLTQGLTPTWYLRQILEQMWRIGYNSLPVVGLTAFFTGGALALQIYQGSTPGTASTTARTASRTVGSSHFGQSRSLTRSELRHA